MRRTKQFGAGGVGATVSGAVLLCGMVVLANGLADGAVQESAPPLAALAPAGDSSAVAAARDDPPVTIRWGPDGAIDVLGLEPREARYRLPGLRIYTEDAVWTDPTFPSIAGRVDLIEGGLRFTPNHASRPAARRLVFDIGAERVSRLLPAPESALSAAPTVLAVFPSADALPANQLKMYVHFSQPMRRWNPYPHLRLIDETTDELVDHPFHAMRDGLWNAAGTRFTVVFDPGRVKRGLANHDAFGSPLREGRRYRLEIEDDWPDERGVPLGRRYRKRFTVGPADRAKPRITDWEVTPPASPDAPVTLRFGEPMDRELLLAFVDARRAGGARVEGTFEPMDGETSLAFSPSEPWRPGAHELLVDCRLEDLAGNNLGRLFDVDLAAPEDGAGPSTDDCTLSVPFSVGAGGMDAHTNNDGRGS